MTSAWDIVFIPAQGWFIIEVNSETFIEGPFASKDEAVTQLEQNEEGK